MNVSDEGVLEQQCICYRLSLMVAVREMHELVMDSKIEII